EKRRHQFPHDLIREVVLADLSAARRALLHEQVAQALEQEESDRHFEQLAYHYTQAERAEKSVVYLERAGDQAIARHAYADAAAYYREAVGQLERMGRPLEAARLQVPFGAALRLLSRYDEALDALDCAVATYRRAADVDGLGRVALEISQVHLYRRTAHDGLVWLEPVTAELRQRGPSRGLARLYFCLASLSGVTGDYRRELEAIEQARACAPDIYASSDEGGWWREEHAATLFMLGRLEEAAFLLEDSLAVTSEGPRIEAL